MQDYFEALGRRVRELGKGWAVGRVMRRDCCWLALRYPSRCSGVGVEPPWHFEHRNHST